MSPICTITSCPRTLYKPFLLCGAVLWRFVDCAWNLLNACVSFTLPLHHFCSCVWTCEATVFNYYVTNCFRTYDCIPRITKNSHGPIKKFFLALRRPIQLRLKSYSLLELFLYLILFILNLSAAFDTVNQQMLLIIHADLGSLRDCLPPVALHLSDIIEGSSPCCTVSNKVPPQGLVWIHHPLFL